MVKLPDAPQPDTGITPIAPRAQAGAVEHAASNLGAQFVQLSAEFDAAHQVVRRRADAISRAQAREEFASGSRDLFLKEQDEGSNFTHPDAVDKYKRGLDDLRAKILQNHKGSAESSAALEVSLNELGGRYTANAFEQATKSQRELISTQVNDASGSYAEQAANDPSKLPEIMAEFTKEVGSYADATTPQEFQVLSDGGRAKIIAAALNQTVAVGNTANARALYEKHKALLTGDERNRFNAQIGALEGVDARKKAEVAARYARIKQVLPDLKITPTIALAIEGITLPAHKLTLSEKVLEAEIAKGSPLTARERGAIISTHKKIGDETGNDTFGTGRVGKAHSFLVEHAPEFAAGTLDDADNRFFLAAVSIISAVDPNTGQPGNIPPFVREALRRRNYDPRSFTGLPPVPGVPTATGGELLGTGEAAVGSGGGGVPTITPPPLPGAQPQTAPEPGFAQPGGESDKPTLSPNTAVQESRQYEAQGGLLAPQSALPQQTVFQMAQLVTGPMSTIQGKGAHIPIVGGLIESHAITQARAYMPVLVRDLVRVLQNNPRFAEGERRQITKDVELEGQFFDRPERFRDNLIGLDDALAVRQRNAVRTLQEGAIGREEYMHTLNVLNALTKFREALGVPPVITSAEDIKRLGLKSGDLIRLPGDPNIFYPVK